MLNAFFYYFARYSQKKVQLIYKVEDYHDIVMILSLKSALNQQTGTKLAQCEIVFKKNKHNMSQQV